jgi:DNA invertase Pin-like site-specific DNA recombinase
MATYGYARCSTTETKQSVERQTRGLHAMGADHVFCEYASGAVKRRPELQKLLAVVKPGDTIVCTEVTRLTRSVSQLCHIIEYAKEKQLVLKIGSLVIDCAHGIEPMTEATLLIAGVFASLEREMTVERVRSGIAAAKAKGVRLGRPLLRADQLPPLVYRYWNRYKKGDITKSEYAKLCGVSRSTIYRYISLLTDS